MPPATAGLVGVRRAGPRPGRGSRAATAGARSAGASGRPRRGRSSRASRRRSTGSSISAASRTGRPHVVAEHQERAAVGAGAAVQRDPVDDRAHARARGCRSAACARTGRPVHIVRLVLGRDEATARPPSWCCCSRRGRPSRPTVRAARAPSAVRILPDAARVAMRLAVLGREAPAALAAQPSGSAAGRHPSE